MKCPRCINEMTVEEWKDVEIDVCPACGGIYLDRGEMDEISRLLRASNPESERAWRLGRNNFCGDEQPKHLVEPARFQPDIFLG